MPTNIHMVKDKRKKTFDPGPVFKILKLIFLKKKFKISMHVHETTISSIAFGSIQHKKKTKFIHLSLFI